MVSLISYHNSVESVEKMVGNRVFRLASSVGEELSGKIRSRLGDNLLLGNDELQSYLQTSLLDSPEDRKAASRDLGIYMVYLFQEYGRYYREIIVADADGNPIFRFGSSRGGAEQSRPGGPAPGETAEIVEEPETSDSVFAGFPEEIPLPGLQQEMAELEAPYRLHPIIGHE